jgi:hypothetical protein
MIMQALSNLLNFKHLYQHVDVPLNELLSRVAPTDTGLVSHMISHQWAAEDEVDYAGQAKFPHWPRPRFGMPLLKTYCPECEEVFPFNPAAPTNTYTFSDTYQIFALPFQCQGCKGTPVVFVVTRDGNKLTLTGRSEIESVLVPDYIPKPQRKHYSGARLAFNCNQILPALFLLRTLIEQYMLSVVPGDYKVGDDLYAAYNAKLGEDFKARFPSFADVYAKLSDALHEAREDTALFESEIERIESHFDGKRTYERAAKVAARGKPT